VTGTRIGLRSSSTGSRCSRSISRCLPSSATGGASPARERRGREEHVEAAFRHQPSYACYAGATVTGYFVPVAGIALCLAIALVALLTSSPLHHLVRRGA
jgi:hypothetical protein